MAETFYTLLTSVGLAKLTNAQVTGTTVNLTTMKAGDGNGVYYNPTDDQTDLVNTVWSGAINTIYVDPTNANYMIVEAVIPETVGGFDIREVGIFDDVGDMIGVGKYPETYKPALSSGSGKDLYLRFIMETSNTAQITIKIDPAIVLATKKDIDLHDDDVAAHRAMRHTGIVKDAVRVATTAEISLSGEQTIDGVGVVAGDAVLVKDQSTASVNGIYVASTGAWARRADADEAIKLTPRMMVPVKEGTANGGTIWWLTTSGAITLGTTDLFFEQPFARLAGSASQVFRAAQAVAANDVVTLDQAKALASNVTHPYGFYKADSGAVAFTKTGAGTLSVKAGTRAMVNGTMVEFAADTAVVMPAHTAGTDYAIYACTDGTVRADASFTAPAGYDANTSRMIGGYHYGLVAEAETVAGGSFATTGNGMIWTQADVDKIAGINQYSLWDLKWRTRSSGLRAQKGFVYVPERGLWVAAYLASTDVDTNGLSAAGSNIASGTVLPKIPAAFGGNGVATYTGLTWWVANEIAAAFGAKLVRESDFVVAAFGVTENQSIDSTAATYPTTQRNAGYTSKYGIEQATGHHWTWGEDASFRPDGTVGWAWNDVNSGRGQVYLQNTLGLVRVILGGHRTNGVYSGSRCSHWYHYPWYSNWPLGLRAACDHLQLV